MSLFVFKQQGSKINNVWNEIEKTCNEVNYIAYTFSNQLLKDLMPDTYYQIELRAHNAIGFSLPTHIYMRTAKGGKSEMSINTYHYSSFSVTSFALLTSSLSQTCLILCFLCSLINF